MFFFLKKKQQFKKDSRGQQKHETLPSMQSMILHENRLPADDSHEICLICYF